MIERILLAVDDSPAAANTSPGARRSTGVVPRSTAPTIDSDMITPGRSEN